MGWKDEGRMMKDEFRYIDDPSMLLKGGFNLGKSKSMDKRSSLDRQNIRR
jgi:hypothetical protein